MKLICINNRGRTKQLVIGKIYEGVKNLYYCDFRWKVDGFPGISFLSYRFKEYKTEINENIKIL